MRIYFDYYGDFSQYTKDDLCFGAIEFDTNGKHYIVDAVGEVNYDFENNHISGRFKGDYEIEDFESFYKENFNKVLSNDEIVTAIMNMDTFTFRYNILDDGEEPEYRKLEVTVEIGDKKVEICKAGKQPMKVREFSERLRAYPNWDVDLLIENQKTKTLDDIVDIICDERNGNLIIVKRENQ